MYLIGTDAWVAIVLMSCCSSMQGLLNGTRTMQVDQAKKINFCYKFPCAIIILLLTRFGVAVVQRSQNGVRMLLGYESYIIVK